MDIFTSETLRMIVIFFVPGFISMKIYDLCFPSERRDFSKSVLEAVSFSFINFALTYGAIIAIHKSDFQIRHPYGYYFASIAILFIAPIIWPVLYAKILSFPFIRRRTIHPISKPWDYVFSQNRSYWIIIHLKDGRRIGGRFDTNSFASSYPADEQLYLEEVWHLDKKGRFRNKVEGSKGIIISSQDYASIEFFQQL